MDAESILESQVARVTAEIERLQAELDAGQLTVPGSKGQPVPNRLLAELRAHRWLLARLLGGAAAATDMPPPGDAVDRIRAEWEAGDE